MFNASAGAVVSHLENEVATFLPRAHHDFASGLFAHHGGIDTVGDEVGKARFQTIWIEGRLPDVGIGLQPQFHSLPRRRFAIEFDDPASQRCRVNRPQFRKPALGEAQKALDEGGGLVEVPL